MKFVLAFILLCLTAGQGWAACTTLPFTLLPGVPPDGAQMMADLQALNDNCAATGTQAGRIIMFPSLSWSASATSTTAWTVVVPVGVAFSCVTTQSQCFDEVLAAAYVNGKSLDIYCPGENQPATTYPFIASNTAITTRALAQRYIHAHGCNITFSSAVSGTAFQIDTTLDGGFFWWDGQIVGLNSTPSESPLTATVAIKPQTCPPNEGCLATVIQNSMIRIGAVVGASVAGATAHGAVVAVDMTNGSASSNNIWIGEINGCGPCKGAPFLDGFRVFGGSTTRGFFRNRVEIGYIHNVVRPLDNGSTDNTDTANPKAYNDNEFILGNASPGDTAGICVIDSAYRTRIKVYSCNNDSLFPSLFTNALTLTVNTHFVRADISAQTGYSRTISTIAGASTPSPIIDLGTANSYVLDGQVVQDYRGMDRGVASASGAQYNYLPIASLVAGTGGSATSTPTNAFGQVVVGTGSPTTVTVTRSITVGRAGGCTASDNAGDILYPTSDDGQVVTFTSNNAMSAGVLVTYNCVGLP